MSQGNESARKEVEILRILSEYGNPVGSILYGVAEATLSISIFLRFLGLLSI